MSDGTEREQIKVRTVTVKGVIYIRAADVAELFTDFAACEESDVRIRANEFADNIRRDFRVTP